MGKNVQHRGRQENVCEMLKKEERQLAKDRCDHGASFFRGHYTLSPGASS